MFRFRKLTAIFLLALSLQWVVPRELWHELCHHKDSIDCQAAGTGTSVSIQHEHCLILELSLPPMWQDTQHFIFSPDHDFSTILVDGNFIPPSIFALVSGNRGPPCLT